MSLPCSISAWGCPYHACMTDECQKRFVISTGVDWGMGNCKEEIMKELSKRLGDQFISHYSSLPWGEEILIMEKTGIAFCRVYKYNDDSKTVYLDMLSVSPEHRNKGIGTELQRIRETIGIIIGAKRSCLWTQKDSWMHDWYKRRGYVDFMDHKDEPDAIWMKKPLTEAVGKRRSMHRFDNSGRVLYHRLRRWGYKNQNERS